MAEDLLLQTINALYQLVMLTDFSSTWKWHWLCLNQKTKSVNCGGVCMDMLMVDVSGVIVRK
jgi:hypothetical protein